MPKGRNTKWHPDTRDSGSRMPFLFGGFISEVYALLPAGIPLEAPPENAGRSSYHRLVLSDGNIFHKAAPESFVEFQHRLGQLIQFIDETLEFAPADSALPDLRRDLFTLCLGGLVPADRRIVGCAVVILVYATLAFRAISSCTASASAFSRSSSSCRR